MSNNINSQTGEIEEDNGLPVSGIGALEAITRGEIDTQIATAKRYPRSIKLFMQNAHTLATLNEETAESCFYKLPRKDQNGNRKDIEGPSIRLAEIAASAWQNLRIGSMITDIGETMVTARGMVHDLETNVAYFADVQRRITTKKGQRFGDDMIIVTANAAAAIATRNAILKAVPRAYIDQVMHAAKEVAVGTSKTLVERRNKAVEYFTQKAGVPLERVLAALEVAAVEDITLVELETLTGLKVAIRDNATTLDEAFPRLATNGVDKLNSAFATPVTTPVAAVVPAQTPTVSQTAVAQTAVAQATPKDSAAKEPVQSAKNIESIPDALSLKTSFGEKFNVPLKKLEELIGRNEDEWQNDDLTTLGKILQNLLDGQAEPENYFGKY